MTQKFDLFPEVLSFTVVNITVLRQHLNGNVDRLRGQYTDARTLLGGGEGLDMLGQHADVDTVRDEENTL